MRLAIATLVAAIVTVAAADDAHAYLDPGTGSILLQGLLAAIAGAAVTVGFYWSKVKAFFTGRARGERDDDGKPRD